MAEWISARDRTPEPGKTVLCYYQYEISGMKHFNFMFGDYDNGWHRLCTTGYHYDSCIEPLDVLYWIELPQLPQLPQLPALTVDIPSAKSYNE